MCDCTNYWSKERRGCRGLKPRILSCLGFDTRMSFITKNTKCKNIIRVMILWYQTKVERVKENEGITKHNI